ncbi:MAG: MobF family relaxase [Stellaceae bacterium]
MTYRVGACASLSSGKAMAEYYLAGTLKAESTRAAEYYTGAEAKEERAADFWRGPVREGHLAAGGTVAELRPDLSPALAARLGIANPGRPLTQAGIANLLNATRLDGAAIAGRKKHTATRSVAELFDLDPMQPASAKAIWNVLAGKRADGGMPQNAAGKPLPAEIVEGARKRFKTALGVPAHREATVDELMHLENGRLATGRLVDMADYRRQIHATRPPVGFVDMTFSADKSLSVAWALAPTAAEQTALLEIHRHAVADTMAYAETHLGVARRGQGGGEGVETGELGWIGFQHYTARPAVDIERRDREGRLYTDIREVPLQTADPQLHTHVTVFNSVLTGSGHIGALDLDRLAGRVKELGAVYHANVATRARQLGIETVLDQRTGAARLADIPHSVRELFSKRTLEAQEAAREFAASRDIDWDAITAEQKIALLKVGAAETRQEKTETAEGLEQKSDFAVWRAQAAAASYRHRSVLRPDQAVDAPAAEQRHEAAYSAALPLLDGELGRRAVLDGQELREIAARALIVAGIGERPGDDIDAVIKTFRERGVAQDGQQVALLWGRGAPLRGKERWSVTTALHIDQERELIRLARTASLDLSGALPAAQIGRAADAFLERNPAIDPAAKQWQAQRAMMTRLATGGRLGVAIGVAGAGKSTALAPLVEAWQADGREVFGITLAWRQAADLRSAGIDERASVAAFLKRVETGRYIPDRNSVVVVDEVGLIGTRQMLDLLRLQRRTGMQIVMVGDPKQCQSIEAGPVVELLRKAVGETAVPEILTSIRQKTEREREITGLFRAGRAAEALEMKQQDGTAELVAGGRQATVQRVAQLWRQRLEANRGDPEFKLTVSAPTNADAREIGAAIRAERRRAGELGHDVKILDATDRNGETYRLPVAVGDRVRLYDRVHDARVAGRKSVLANNGEVVEIRELTEEGMIVRNDAGAEGMVMWRKIQARKDAPVRLSYGYAMTVDTAQGSTASEHIHAMPAGSHAIHGFKAYTAASRHERTTWIVVDEASERRHLASRSMIGQRPEIGEPEVWRQIAENLSRQPQKASALDMLHPMAETPPQVPRRIIRHGAARA